MPALVDEICVVAIPEAFRTTVLSLSVPRELEK